MIVNLYDPDKDADLRKEWVSTFKAVRNLSWPQIDRATHWQDVLPLPVIIHCPIGDDPLYSIKAQWWEKRAATQLLHWKGLIDKQVELGREHLADLISENKGHTRFLPSAEEAFRLWIESIADYTIKEFTYLPASLLTPKLLHPSTPTRIVNRETVGQFLAQWQCNQKQVGRIVFDTNDQSVSDCATKPPVTDELAERKLDDLTERERVLIHCYEQKPPIKRGERGYNDYIRYCTPKKRLAYPNDSKRKADYLIRSIEKIKPFLNEKEIQQAQSEIDTIGAKFDN